MSKVKLLLNLFLSMLKIGLFTFGGGYAMIHILDSEFVVKKKWLDSEEFLDLVAIAESTPGPIAINCATYIGYKKAGFWGSLFSTVGMCIPSFTIIYLISLFFNTFLSIAWVASAFRGIQVCVVFLILSVTGLRKYIATAMPDCLKKAIPAGIGLFIAYIGFQNVGLIQANQYTLSQLFDFHGAIINADSPFAAWKAMAPVVLAIVGLVLIAVLAKKNVKGNIIISIIVVTVLYYATTLTVPSFDLGNIGQSFKDFATVGVTGVFKPESWVNAFTGANIDGVFGAIVLIITFCLVDMFDTIGTLYGTASQANMLDENGDPINVNEAMMCDSIGTVSGAILGTSTCTTFVESAAGVGAGGRTGLTSVITAACFAVCLFLSPVATLIPSCATAPALIYVGVLMMKNFAKVDMDDAASAVPAFLALIVMVLSYSISNGIGVGAIAYVLITLFTGNYKKKDIVVTIIALLFAARFLLITM